MRILTVLIVICSVIPIERIFSQEKVVQTFRHTRIINAHSVETLPARKLDFRIVHRFGDIAGNAGGFQTFYGLENASDIMMGLEYGLTDNIMIGVNRTKGAGVLRQNINSLLKIRLMNQQKKSTNPFSLTVAGIAAYSTMPSSSLEGTVTSFESRSHRLVYHLGAYTARKFSEAISLQLSTHYTYRNIVEIGDKNDLVHIGVGGRFQVTKSFGIIVDASIPLLDGERNTGADYTLPLGIGFEFDTHGGHVFQINVTNSRGISETDYLPYTTSGWGDGQYRLGFTVSRLFNM